MDQIKINLRDIRNKAGLSLSAAAELTGVSKAMLGQIERGESSPTIATLWKLAKGFHLPLSALIEEPIPDAPHHFKDSITVTTLFAFDTTLRSETFLIDLAPGLEHVSKAHDSGVIEDVVSISGDIEVFFDGEWHGLASGNAFRFAADQPHGYRNIGTQVARFHNTLHYPRKEID
jgi:transcriptional regulator with XRE-family HTH domain